MLIKWWMGTDALKLAMYPPGKKLWYVRIFIERVLWRLFHRFFVHWVNSERLIPYLKNIGISNIEVKPFSINETVYKRKKHDGFNVLFYIRNSVDGNQEYKDWIYGRNIYNKLKACSDFNVILIDGSAVMSELMPVADLYVKVMRHAGSDKNRLAKECELNKIPVFYTDYNMTDDYNVEAIKCLIQKSMYSRNDI